MGEPDRLRDLLDKREKRSLMAWKRPLFCLSGGCPLSMLMGKSKNREWRTCGQFLPHVSASCPVLKYRTANNLIYASGKRRVLFSLRALCSVSCCALCAPPASEAPPALPLECEDERNRDNKIKDLVRLSAPPLPSTGHSDKKAVRPSA